MKYTPPIPSCSNENFCFHAGDYSFGFNGKDKESEFNSGAYDFGARIHDARLGRWMSVDRFSGVYVGTSCYGFVNGNPISFIDGDGNTIVDPETKKTVVYQDGKWQTLEFDAEGNKVYGDVSTPFKNKSLPVLEKLTENKVGLKIIDELQQLSTRVIFDIEDEQNLKDLKELGGNSRFHSNGPDPAKGQFYEEVVITPDIIGLTGRALQDGVDFQEKFLQTMSIEKDHIDDPSQISYELSIGKQPQNSSDFRFMYEGMLNDAIRIGLEYRKEKLDKKTNEEVVSYSSFAPYNNTIEKVPFADKLKLDKENSKLYKKVEQ